MSALASAVVFAFSSPFLHAAASAAVSVWDGGAGTTDLNTPNNWTPDGVPGRGSTLRWDGTVPGNLALGFEEELANGWRMEMTASQTGSVTITNSSSTSYAIRLLDGNTVSIAAGAGAFRVGDVTGGNPIGWNMGTASGDTFTMNYVNASAHVAVFGTNVMWGRGGRTTDHAVFSGDWTILGPIKNIGNGVITKTGAGTLSLSGDNTFSGGVAIVGGTVATASANALGTGPVKLAPGGTLAITGALDLEDNLDVNGGAIVFGLTGNPAGENARLNVAGSVVNTPGAVTLIALRGLSADGALGEGTYTLMACASSPGTGAFALDQSYPNVTLNSTTTGLTLTVGAGVKVSTAVLNPKRGPGKAEPVAEAKSKPAPAAPALPGVEYVIPIDWSKFKCQPATGDSAERFGKVLLNANKYALTTWWKEHGFEQFAADGYLEFKGRNERCIRPAASEAQGLAVSLRLGLYNPEATGVSRADAERKTLELIRSVAHRHRANSPGGWGSEWQSPSWAEYTIMAGWLMWDQLDATTRTELVKMAESEAGWVMSNKKHPNIKTYRDRSGKVISPGDTGTEENAWDASLLVAVTAMMPKHPQYSRWMNRMVTLMLLAHARPSDVNRTDIIHGKPLSKWLPGSNMNEDGTVINHGRIHPDYMTSGLYQFCPAGAYTLAGAPVPEVALFNLELPYRALADLQFVAGQKMEGRPVQPPGGTIFKPDSADVYFPQGNDWGTGRRENFADADAVIVALTKDAGLKQRAAVWEQKHAEHVLGMQARFQDGRTYGDQSEDSFHSREECVAASSSNAYLLKWLMQQVPLRFTNEKF